MNEKQPFEELKKFREESQKTRSPYELGKRRIYIYKAIFIGIGILFMILTFQVYYRPIHWLCERLLANCYALKSLLMFFSFGFALLALWMGIHMDPAHEIAHQLYTKHYKLLRKIFLRKKRLLRKRTSLSRAEYNERYNDLETLFETSLEKLLKKEHDAFTLIHTISQASQPKKERELLFDQLLRELQHDYDLTVQEFEEKSSLSLPR